MNKTRLEAFSDGVLAIVITIMVLELKVPHGESSVSTLRPLIPVFFSYVLSFIYVGIYWNNHHHLFQVVQRVSGPILWANLHLLFWLSLVPFATGWMGQNNFSTYPVFLYGIVLTGAAIAYFILTIALVSQHGKNSSLAQALGKDFKGKISILLYLAALGAAFLNPAISYALYIGVAIIWLIPDKRMERVLENKKH